MCSNLSSHNTEKVFLIGKRGDFSLLNSGAMVRTFDATHPANLAPSTGGKVGRAAI